MEVLVLNSTYEPLQVLALRKAVKLITKNRADIIKSFEGKSLTSCYESMPLPSVIKLSQYVKYHRKPIPFSKKNVLIRDKHTCQYCGSQDTKMTIDHVHPKSKGGENTWDNTVTCCTRCNTIKADRTVKQAGFVLAKNPKRPSPFLFMKHLSKRQDWEEFMYISENGAA